MSLDVSEHSRVEVYQSIHNLIEKFILAFCLFISDIVILVRNMWDPSESKDIKADNIFIGMVIINQ